MFEYRFVVFLVFYIYSNILAFSEEYDEDWIDSIERSMVKELLKCSGETYFNSSMAAYFPEYEQEIEENGAVDVRNNPLKTLQDYLDDQADYVTVAMDPTLQIPYGTSVCIPELNEHYGQRIKFQVRDSDSHLRGRKYRRIDVCVRSESDSYDKHVNKLVTLVF